MLVITAFAPKCGDARAKQPQTTKRHDVTITCVSPPRPACNRPPRQTANDDIETNTLHTHPPNPLSLALKRHEAAAAPLPFTMADATQYHLVVSAGPSYDTSTHRLVPVNKPEPLTISTPDIQANLNVRIQNYRGEPRPSVRTRPRALTGATPRRRLTHRLPRDRAVLFKRAAYGRSVFD